MYALHSWLARVKQYAYVRKSAFHDSTYKIGIKLYALGPIALDMKKLGPKYFYLQI